MGYNLNSLLDVFLLSIFTWSRSSFCLLPRRPSQDSYLFPLIFRVKSTLKCTEYLSLTTTHMFHVSCFIFLLLTFHQLFMCSFNVHKTYKWIQRLNKTMLVSPVVWLCLVLLLRYDFVGHLETLEEDAEHLLKILKLENIKFPPPYANMTTTGSMLDWFRAVPLEDRRKLYQIYKEDFRLFGYQKPVKLLNDWSLVQKLPFSLCRQLAHSIYH